MLIPCGRASNVIEIFSGYNLLEIPLFSLLQSSSILEIVFTKAAPAFDKLLMGCVFNINTVYKTIEQLKFQPFY